MAVNKGVKCHCKECDNQVTAKSSFTQHKMGVHEGVEFVKFQNIEFS